MNHRRIALLTLAIAIALGFPLGPRVARAGAVVPLTYYVGQHGVDYPSGSSCADADYWTDGVWTGGGEYDSDNDAIQDAADHAESGSIIHLCTGTYNFVEEVTIIGGKSLTFQGDGNGETTLDGMNSAEHNTRIFNSNTSQSSDLGGVLTISDLMIMNAGVPIVDDKNGGTINADGLNLDNVTIMNSLHAFSGGALYAEGNVTIADSTFLNNTSRYDGGVLYAWNEDRTVTVINSLFEANHADDNGGAIMAAGDLIITGTDIVGNSSDKRPGGVLAGKNLQVTNSRFEGNISALEDAGALSDVGVGATVSIQGSSFINNSSYTYGGAIVMHNIADLEIENTLFKNNQSTRGFGGAINLSFVDNVTITSSTFTGNEALGGNFGANGNGGAIDACNIDSFTSNASRYLDNVSTLHGGAIGLFGITCASPGTITMTNNFFSGNSARSAGGALWLSGTLASMIGNQFLGNESGSLGGAVYGGWSEDAELVTRVVQRNTFTGNRAAEGGGAIWLPGQIDALTRNTFVRNWTGGDGGAIAVSGLQGRGWLAIKGNRITRNTAEGRGGAFSLQCSSFSRSAQRRLVAANSLNGNVAASDRRSSGIYLASVC